MKLLLIAAVSLLLVGCAVGRGPGGEIVVGVNIATLPETVSEIGGAVAGAIFGPQTGTIVATALASILGVGSVGVATTSGRAKEKARKLADQGREKAEKEAVALRMLVQMLKNGKEQPSEPSA